MTRKKSEELKKKEEIFSKTARIVEDVPAEEFVSENFLPYAWSVTLDRALVKDDGLKPIQRRILYTCYKLGITDKSNKMKSATFEGRVMELSPHGGSYGSIVNIAESESKGQPRPIRIPLIRGKGSWGGLEEGAAACLTGDLKIALFSKGDIADYITIDELLTKDLDKETYTTLTVSKSGDKVPGRISHVWSQGKQETLIITLSNGNSIRATKNHRFLLYDYTEVFAGDLVVGDVLASHSTLGVFITNIEKNTEPELVYDVEIDGENHNFLLESDIFAHNSRYTEMSLWPAAMELLKELPEDAVDFVPNYNNEEMEPIQLPARWPVAIINGVPDAMAVGFACNIPNHNPDEIMDACIAYVKNPKMTIDDFLKIIKGPDFNCGCDIITDVVKDGENVNGVKQYLTTGSGSFIMRATYDLSEDNGIYTLNFRHLPYKIGPEKIIETINSQYQKGNFKELTSWKDLSDLKNPVNLEIKTKKGININKLIEDLYRLTPLQSIFAANNTVVVKNIPQKLDIKSLIANFVEFRRNCTTRKLNYRLNKKKQKMHIQEGMLSVILDIDKCIEIIRSSSDSEAARKKLMKEFKIDEEQADHVLSLQLRRLTKSDSNAIKVEIKELKKEISEIESILKSKKKMNDFLVSELEDTKKVISSPRLCKIMKNARKSREEDRQVYVTFDGTNITRSFEESEDSYKVKDNGFVGVLTSKQIFIRSIYEIPDNKKTSINRFSFSGRGIAVLPNEGYLLIVGDNGSAKIVDLSTMNLPKKDFVDKVFSQNIVFAKVMKNIKGVIDIEGGDDCVTVKLSDIPIQSIGAMNGKRFLKKKVDNVYYEE